MKHLPGNFFSSVAAYAYSEYFCVLPPAMTVADLFNPVTWSHHAARLNPHDLVRVRSNDGSVDIMLVVDAVSVGGVHVSAWPKLAGAVGGEAVTALADIAKDATPNIVPLDRDGKPKVRVEYLAATEWRVLGLNGEVAKGFRTEAEAVAKMEEYLKLAGLTMPEPKAESEPAVPQETAEAEGKAPARKVKAKETA